MKKTNLTIKYYNFFNLKKLMVKKKTYEISRPRRAGMYNRGSKKKQTPGKLPAFVLKAEIVYRCITYYQPRIR